MATALNTLKQAKADNEAAQAKLRVEGRKLLTIASAQRTDQQNARLDAIDSELNTLAAELVTITGDLAKEERVSEAARNGGRAGDQLHSAPGASLDDDGDDSARPAAGPKWEQLFPGQARAFDDWDRAHQGNPRAAAREFFSVVGGGLHDPRLRADSMTTTSGGAGGYAVPSGILAGWWNDALEGAIVTPRATLWPMLSDERRVPAWDIRNRASNVGGLAIQWTKETGSIDYQVGKLRRITLKARKGAILVEASNELLADGLTMSAQIDNGLKLSLGYGLDQSFLFGSGSNQPLGVLHANAGATIVVSKDGGQTVATITYSNLTNMFSRLAPGSLESSVWVAHPSTIPQLSTLTVAVGAGGSVIPVMTSGSGQFTILTRPVVFSEKMNPLGSRGDIVLADFSQYLIGLRKEAAIDRSAHVGFTRDVETFRLTLRIDGQPAVDTPFQPPNNAPTLSPFVTLEARS